MKRYTLDENPTIFGQILRDELPCTKVYEDEVCIVIENTQPKAPIHLLVIPRQHIAGVQDIRGSDALMIGCLHIAADNVAIQMGFKEQGYRMITNAGEGAGQTIFHLHYHLISGHDRMSGF